jgi:OOP family OmpA-OmpF porin
VSVQRETDSIPPGDKGVGASGRVSAHRDNSVAFRHGEACGVKGIAGLDRANDQVERCLVEREVNSMSGFRPKRLLLCLVVVSALIGAFGVHAGFTTEPGLRAAQAQLVPPSSDLLRVADKADEPAAGYMWSAMRIESGIRLRGSVPTTEDRRTVLGMVKAHFPDLDVEDRLKIADGFPPHDQWLGAVSFGLKQLSHLKRGSVRLHNVMLKLDGEARSAADYIEVKKALAGALPTGLVVANISIRPPVADPFIFVADLGTNALSLTGSVPSENARKQVRELSRQLFRRPGLDDRLELASGAPKDWDEAVAAALRALSRLESGKIALSGLAVTIQGVAPDQGTAVAVSYQLRRDLPDLFSTSESISWKEAAMPADMAAQVIPRIKSIVRGGGQLPGGVLPEVLPLLDGE